MSRDKNQPNTNVDNVLNFFVKTITKLACSFPVTMVTRVSKSGTGLQNWNTNVNYNEDFGNSKTADGHTRCFNYRNLPKIAEDHYRETQKTVDSRNIYGMLL